jgi:hypothetical protein
MKKKFYKTVLDVTSRTGHKTGRYCCWVNEHGGYFAYCHSDGRLITRTGNGEEHNPQRTWSTVGQEVLSRIIRNK